MIKKQFAALIAASLIIAGGAEIAQAQGSAMRSMGTSNPYQADRMMHQQRRMHRMGYSHYMRQHHRRMHRYHPQ